MWDTGLRFLSIPFGHCEVLRQEVMASGVVEVLIVIVVVSE